MPDQRLERHGLQDSMACVAMCLTDGVFDQYMTRTGSAAGGLQGGADNYGFLYQSSTRVRVQPNLNVQPDL